MFGYIIPAKHIDVIRAEYYAVPDGWTWICDITRPGQKAICLFRDSRGYLHIQEEGAKWPDTDTTLSATGSCTIMI